MTQTRKLKSYVNYCTRFQLSVCQFRFKLHIIVFRFHSVVTGVQKLASFKLNSMPCSTEKFVTKFSTYFKFFFFKVIQQLQIFPYYKHISVRYCSDCKWRKGRNRRMLTKFNVLDAFAKLPTTTISFAISVCLSAWNYLAPLRGFCWNLIFEYFSKTCQGNLILIKVWQ
jgi:hypothetical protein